MMKTWLRLAILVLFISLLAACGGNTDEQESAENTEENTEGNTEQMEDTESTEAVTVRDAFGEKTFEETPLKVVALEWTYVEDLLALGVQPVGVADIEGYNSWVDIDAELDQDVVDVGTRQEPNLEMIAELEPDLIITAGFRHEAIQQELEFIAPTLFFDPYPTDETVSQYDEMEETFRTIAKVVQKEDEAESVLEELDAKYEEAKEQIAAADLKTNEFVLTQAFSANQAPTLRLFTPNAMATQIFEKVGLENVYDSGQFEMYGYSEVNVEALPAVEDANFFYVVQDDDNVFENQLQSNSVWQNLNFVQNDQLYPLGGDAWLFGGPLSAMTLVDRIVEVVEEE
ncbi:ABC transporter substrate-binding protein [Alkalihalophilus pseudofirmus]|nr:iron-siderophore ABC transporter substrate-binding protein [Alkalihalophilus pseudofirmus]